MPWFWPKKKSSKNHSAPVELVPKEKTFKHFFEFPREVRAMLIDEQEIEDRCKFARLSKACRTEAHASKKFMYGLELCCKDENQREIYVTFSDRNFRTGHVGNGYILEFKQLRRGKRVMRCIVSENVVRWKKYFENQEDTVLDYAIKHFKKLIEQFQTPIKLLRISGDIFLNKDIDFEIEKLSNLRNLDLSSNIVPLIGRVRRPLEILEYEGEDLEKASENLASFEQIIKVTNVLNVPKLGFNYEELILISATDINIHIGNLTQKNIIKFIEAWQGGSVLQNLTKIVFDTENDFTFTVQLFKLLGQNMFETKTIEFQHRQKQEKYGELIGCKCCLTFKAMTKEQ